MDNNSKSEFQINECVIFDNINNKVIDDLKVNTKIDSLNLNFYRPSHYILDSKRE